MAIQLCRLVLAESTFPSLGGDGLLGHSLPFRPSSQPDYCYGCIGRNHRLSFNPINPRMVHPVLVDSVCPGRFSSDSDRVSKRSFEYGNDYGCGRRLDCVACAELSNRSDGVDELDSKLVSATSNCRDSAHNRDACRYRSQSPSVSP